MTPQEVIKKFMARLTNHGFNSADDPGGHMLDAAIRNSSRFHSTQEVLDAMHADALAAEREAVEEVLGSEYAGQLLGDLDENILAEKSSAIKLRKAYIFLEKYCGIQLGKNFLFTSDGNLVVFNISGSETNTDTGAITGADANITLKAGDTDFYGTPLDLNALAETYGRTLEEDGSLIIGTGTFKDGHSIVDETLVNTYTATDSAQVINTGTRNWVVRAGDLDDTISAGGSDSINAGAGDDSIQVTAGGSTVTGGAGNDTINLSADVLDLTVTDFTSDDTLTIQGVFEIGAAKIEDMLLVITDKTGKRKLKFADFSAALDGTVNAGGTSATLGQRLRDSGINLADLTEENNQTYYAEWLGGKLAPDDDYQPTPPPSISTTPARLEVKEQATENYSLGKTGTSAVNLDDFTGLGDGDLVTADGQVLGTVSSSFPATDTFTRNGLTIHLLGTREDDSITAQTFDDLTDAQKTIVAGLFKWWAADCLTLDENSLGISFNSDSAMINDIGLYFYTDTNTEVLAAVSNAQRTAGDGCPTRLTLSVNMKYYDSVDPDDLDGDGKYNGHSGGYLDRTLAHEFVHALMGGNVNFTNTLPQFITEGVAELVHGIDDERSSTIFRLAYDTDALTAALDLSPGTGTADAYSGGYMFLRYFAKQAALQTLLRPAFGDITAQIDLANFEIGDSLYSDDAGNVSTVAGGIFLGNVVDDIEVGGTGGDAIYLVNDCGVNQIIHTAVNDFQVGQLNANVTCLGSDADDYFQIDEGACSIDGGTGNDYIVSTGQYATINTGDGSDTVRLGEGGHNLLLLGGGNNYVRMDGKPQLGGDGSYAVARNYANTITGGSDSDTLNNSSVAATDEFGNAYLPNEVFQGDDGKFFVHGYLDSLGTFVDDNIEVTAVHFYQFNYDQRIDLGDGDNLINLSYLTDGSVLTGGGLDQILVEHADNSTLDAGAEDDLISLGGGSNNLITGGAGLDIVVISNYATDSNTITTGDDADYVLFGRLNDSLEPATFIAHDGNSIVTGAGDDSIDFAGSNNTISGGAGDDFIREISGSAGGNIFLCDDTFGLDTISGFLSNDTIHIADTFSLTDNILTVLRGRNIKGTITFADAEDLTQLKIVSSSDGFIANSDAWDFYKGGSRQFILSGAADAATEKNFYVKGKTITIGKAAVREDGTPVTLLTDGYKLKLGKGMSAPATVKATYAEGIYTTAGKTAGYTLADKSITYTDATTKTFEFSGVDDDATAANFYVKGKTITIGKEAVQTDGTPVTLLTDGYKLKLGKGMSAPATVKANYAEGIYTTAGKSAGYTLADKSITYTDATTKTFEFSGLDDDTTEKNFYVKGKTITIGKEAVREDGTPVTLLTDGYKLKLGKGMSAPATVKANYAEGIYTTAGKSAGYTLADKSITYTDATTKTFEFSGLDDDTTEKNFYVKGKTITIGKEAVREDGTPVELLTDGYTLKLGKGMAEGYTLSDDGKSIACTASYPSNLWGGFGSDLDLYQPSEEFVADDLLPILSVDSTLSPLNDSALKADDLTLALRGDDTFKVNADKFKS